MVRYADDLVLFFKSKEKANNGQRLVKILLQQLQPTIPEISAGSKTAIISESDPLIFLGREVVYICSENPFVARIGNKQIEKIKTCLSEGLLFKKCSKAGGTFHDTTVDLSKSISAYLWIYKYAHNYR